MTNSIEWLLRAMVFVLLAPIVLACVLQIFFIILPWLVVLMAVCGIAGGLGAGLLLRRRLPPRSGTNQLPQGTQPLGAYRVRRPRGRL
jgi:ABC-type multidrug transport system permease subunit